MRAPSQNSDSQRVDCSLQHSDGRRNAPSDAIAEVNNCGDLAGMTGGLQSPALLLGDGGGS